MPCRNRNTHTHTHRVSRVAQNLISFLSGGKWLHKQYVNITEPLCRLTQTTGRPAGLCSHYKSWITAMLSPLLKINKYILLSYRSDNMETWWHFTFTIPIVRLRDCVWGPNHFFFPSVGHNLAEVVSVHAYLCSGTASLIWVGEASLEYVQDDAQVLNNPSL